MDEIRNVYQILKTSNCRDITPCSPAKINHVLQQHIASIFMAEEQAKQEASMNQAPGYTTLYPRRHNSSQSPL
jgi:hypothetical protein